MLSRILDNWRTRLAATTAFLCVCSMFVGGRILAQEKGSLDIQASAEYAEFIRAIAVPTALAETQPGNFVKFLRIGKNENGEIVVLGIGLLPINEHAGADLGEGSKAIVIAHVHHRLMKQAPVREDAATVRGLGVSNFVISADGRSIWEVGVAAGHDMYREISPKSAGEWRTLE